MNLALHAPKLSHMSEEDLLNIVGLPETEYLTRIDGEPLEYGVPKQIVGTAQWPGWYEDEDRLDEGDLRILEFGASFPRANPPEKLFEPSSLQVPESIFTDSVDHRVDLWRAGVTVRYAVVYL